MAAGVSNLLASLKLCLLLDDLIWSKKDDFNQKFQSNMLEYFQVFQFCS